jgi:hypothetical protein
MNAAFLVDPIEYQPRPGEPTGPTKLLRTLHFAVIAAVTLCGFEDYAAAAVNARL